MNEEKVEFLNEDILTDEQKTKINKKIMNMYNEEKNIVMGAIIIFPVIWLIIFSSFSIMTKDITMLVIGLVIGILYDILVILQFFLTKKNPNNFILVKATVIAKGRSVKVPSMEHAIIKSDNKKYGLYVFNRSLYEKIKLNKTRVYVIARKDNKKILKGTIMMDITNMISE